MRSTGGSSTTWSSPVREAITAVSKHLRERLEDLWNADDADSVAGDPLGLLRYRSNLLGADLRITNFGGGNTSSKFERPDPLTGEPVRVMAVKGSGGDLRSIDNAGFALLYLDKLERLIARYRGEPYEDEMAGFYPLCAFGGSRVAASIDTGLHAFLPFDHIDHLHPDSAIGLAASANGRQRLAEFNRRYDRRLVWMPWQRPGFELALMLRQVVAAHPGCDGIVLGSHGLFTWGATQRECYANSIQTIDQMGEFVDDHRRARGVAPFGGAAVMATIDRDSTAAAILPGLRGALSSDRRVVAHFERSEEVLEFANSVWAEELCRLGTSCPDHFLRTRISPMFVPWDPSREAEAVLRERVAERLRAYRAAYVAYYRAHAQADSPALRGSNPSVVVIPALGIFGFGRDKREARITTEFFVNAIHVMAGATALEHGDSVALDDRGPAAIAGAGVTAPGAVGTELPQARRPEQAAEFTNFHNYVALPRSEAFRIEYWALEEAKLQRMPPDRDDRRSGQRHRPGGCARDRGARWSRRGCRSGGRRGRSHVGRRPDAVVAGHGYGGNRGRRDQSERGGRAARDGARLRRHRCHRQHGSGLSGARTWLRAGLGVGADHADERRQQLCARR